MSDPTPAESKPRRWSLRITLAEILIVVAIIGTLAAIATPKYGVARARANTRACYANQKTLAGAIEMYNLDHKTFVTRVESVEKALVEEGYLHHPPTDPGGGGGQYSLRRDHPLCGRHGTAPDPECPECSRAHDFEVECSVHGTIIGSGP